MSDAYQDALRPIVVLTLTGSEFDIEKLFGTLWKCSH